MVLKPFSHSFLLSQSPSPTSLRQRQLIAFVATPHEEGSLRNPQGDRLMEAHDTDERPNICTALHDRQAKMQSRMGILISSAIDPPALFPRVGFDSPLLYIFTSRRLSGEPD